MYVYQSPQWAFFQIHQMYPALRHDGARGKLNVSALQRAAQLNFTHSLKPISCSNSLDVLHSPPNVKMEPTITESRGKMQTFSRTQPFLPGRLDDYAKHYQTSRIKNTVMTP